MGIGNRSTRRLRTRDRLLRGAVATAVTGALAATALAGAVAAHAATAGGYQFVTLGSHRDRTFNQLLGVNNHDVAVGFYVNGQGQTRGYEYNIAKRSFSRVTVPGAPGGTRAPDLTAAAINDHGDVAGFYNVNANLVDGFLRLRGGTFIKIQVRGATMTQAFGVNNHDTVVGAYTDTAGNSHGFVFRVGGSYVTGVDDPNGIGTTLLNGINNEGDIVGFYTDAAGRTDGLLGYPAF